MLSPIDLAHPSDTDDFFIKSIPKEAYQEFEEVSARYASTDSLSPSKATVISLLERW
jgi:hypothetical protein